VAFFLTSSTPLRTGAPYLLLVAAVILGTWYGGLGPGLVASFLAIASSVYSIYGAVILTGALEQRDLLRLLTFVLTTLTLSLLAADRDRARESAREQARRQAAVAELGLRAVADQDLQSLMDEATIVLCRTLGVEYSYVMELLPGGQALALRAGHGWKPGYVNSITVPAGAGSQAGYTLLSKSPVVSPDLSVEKRFHPPQLLFDHDIVSTMTVVIAGSEHPFGIVGAHAERRRDFTDEDIHFFQAVANVLAAAVQHRHAEHSLSRATDLLETMFSSVDLCIAYLDRYFNFIRVNRAYAQANGREPEFYPGKNHFILFPNAENEAIFRSVVETGEPYAVYAKPFENAEQPERGVTYWDWNLQPVKDPDGTIGGLVLSLVDVTERVRAQEAYREAAEQLRQVLMHTPLAIGALDRNGVLTVAEGSLLERFGFKREEILGKSIWEVSPDLPNVQAAVKRALDGEPGTVDFEIQGRILLCDFWPVKDAQGQVTAVRGMALDVTERRRGEEQLRDLAREVILLQEQDRYQIARILNDEIGQVLAASKMSFESVRRDLADERAILLQERMSAAVAQIGETITQIRTLAQVLRPAALKAIGLNGTLADYSRTFGTTHDITIDYDGAEIDGLPDVVSISLFRFLQEAFDNAVKHAHAHRIAVKLEQDRDSIGLCVQYDGNGFDTTAFVAGPRGRRRAGLSTAQERFRLLGGSLEIESHPGQGTRLVARLPRSDPPISHERVRNEGEL
jgi:PAS domain S-box-containing protein